MTLVIPVSAFSLKDTLECGQAFRWRFHDGWYHGVVGGCALKVRQEGAALRVEMGASHLTVEALRHYFALDVDLPRILASIDVDAFVHEAIRRHRGLRILRQEPWECLASFLCSSYNNITRIQGMIERLCGAFGTPVAFNGFRGCSFPRPETIANASERRLWELGLGFRAPYLRATARLIANGNLPLEALRRTDYWVAKSALRRCDGVGDKVADCVALFGLEKYEAFPIDLWIERAMRYYFQASPMTPRRMHAFAWSHFGRYAGYAQQYLYHYVRTVRGSRQQPAASAQPTHTLR